MRHRLLLGTALALAAAPSCGGGDGADATRPAYPDATRAAFDALVAGPEWDAAGARDAPDGLLVARHVKTALDFVLVPAGTFRMGSSHPEFADEAPVHKVTVSAFLLARTECTQAAWEKAGGVNRSRWRGADLPVERVTWEECASWCAGAGLRLPTEAEWEHAARGGTTTAWSSGDDEASLDAHAWTDRSSSKRSHPVAGLAANPLGLFDVHGNLGEWCADWAGDYAAGDAVDPTGPATGEKRTLRGGCWRCPAQFARSAARGRAAPTSSFDDLGLRPAASLPAR